MYRFKAIVARHYAASIRVGSTRNCYGRALYVDETRSIFGRVKDMFGFLQRCTRLLLLQRLTRGLVPARNVTGFNGVLISDFFTAYDALDMPPTAMPHPPYADLNDDC